MSKCQGWKNQLEPTISSIKSITKTIDKHLLDINKSVGWYIDQANFIRLNA